MSKIGNLMQSLMMSNPHRASWFLSKMPSDFWVKKGKSKAFALFNEVYEKVPAYRRFLEEKQADSKDIRSFEDFGKLPLVDKKNYIAKNSLENLCFDKNLYKMHTIFMSSGSTGEPFLWPRFPEQDKIIPMAMNLLYTSFFNIDKKPTLLLITLALGTWAAGELAAEASRKVASDKKTPLVVMTPGLDIDASIKIVKKLGNKFKQIIIIGYPPFVKDIIEEGEKKEINWKELNIKILAGGEGFSEEWRDYVSSKIGAKDNLKAIINLFATADAGILGYETPFTVLIKKLANKYKDLNKKLFKEENSSPYLFQYNPMAQFIEEIKGEIVITARCGIPLVRYNIHDRGGVISYDKMLSILKPYKNELLDTLKKNKITEKDIWRLPFFYVFGRSDAVILRGANIYVEHIKQALENPELFKINTGRFKTSIINNENQNEFLRINIELSGNILPSEDLKRKYKEIIIKTLLQLNSEYKSVYETYGETIAVPVIHLYKFKEDIFKEDTSPKNKYLN